METNCLLDPLLQAIVLTAIVIGFGMTGVFTCKFAYRTYKVTKEDEIEGLRGKMMLELIDFTNVITIPLCLNPCILKNNDRISKYLYFRYNDYHHNYFINAINLCSASPSNYARL